MQNGDNRMFRQEALDRLSSPEQLDQMVALTTPWTWPVAAILGAVVLAALLWGVFGHVSSWVDGDGLLVKRGGHLFDAMASNEGTVVSVQPVGSLVHAGDAVAVLDETAKRQDVEHARAQMQERIDDRSRIAASYAQQIALKDRITGIQKADQAKVAQAAEERRDFYRAMLTREQSVIAQGVVSQRFVEETRQKSDDADEQARRARAAMLRLDADQQDLHNLRDQALVQADEAISQAKRHVEELEVTLGRETRIVSPLDGQVTEIKATPGTVVAAGKPIVSIESAGQGLEVLLYVPPETGKRVAAGMPVHVEPVTLKREQFGTLDARVVDITAFPVTAEGMLSELQNRDLVAGFMAHGPPYQARIELAPDAGSASGYRWSGGRGPAEQLTSGTIVHAEITVARQSPLSLVFPALAPAPASH